MSGSLSLTRAGFEEVSEMLVTVQRDRHQVMAELAVIDTTRLDSLRFAAAPSGSR
jgi:hypothetical protein